MPLIPLATITASALVVILFRTVTGAETPGDGAGQTITTLALAALMNVMVEAVKRFQTRAQQSNDVASGAGTLVDAAVKLNTSQSNNLDRFAAQVIALDQRIKGQDERIERMEGEIGERDERIERLEGERDKRDERIEAQDKVIEKLKADNSALDDWVRRLTNNQEANIVHIKDLDRQIATLKRERQESDAAHAEDKARTTAELRALSNGVDQLTAQLRQLGHTPAWERSNGAQP